jgi:hypothetical protein
MHGPRTAPIFWAACRWARVHIPAACCTTRASVNTSNEVSGDRILMVICGQHLSLCDFYLWETVKQNSYRPNSYTIEELKEIIRNIYSVSQWHHMFNTNVNFSWRARNMCVTMKSVCRTCHNLVLFVMPSSCLRCSTMFWVLEKIQIWKSKWITASRQCSL